MEWMIWDLLYLPLLQHLLYRADKINSVSNHEEIPNYKKAENNNLSFSSNFLRLKPLKNSNIKLADSLPEQLFIRKVDKNSTNWKKHSNTPTDE